MGVLVSELEALERPPGDEEPLGRVLREIRRFGDALKRLRAAEAEEAAAAVAMVIERGKRIDRAAREYACVTAPR